MTLPEEFRTLPNRTATKRVRISSRCPYDSTIHSQSAFDCPSRFLGFAALSDDTRLIALEDLAHLRAVTAVAEDGRNGGEIPLVDELALDVEQRRFRVLHENEPGRFHTRDLAAQLGADRPAGAGDEDR